MTSAQKVIDTIQTYIRNTDERNNKPELTSSSWYLPNRAGFVKSIHSIFNKYELKKQEEGKTNLDKVENNKLDLFPHQKFVRDYMQEDSPSRGLLLYHGLGVGKTCASIATAELLATNMKICVMLPASLESNYINEVLKCGQPLYSLNQNWSFIHHKQVKQVGLLSDILNIIDQKTYDKNGGFWFSTPNKKSNYEKYNAKQQEQINRQINNIILTKYNILHYNGLSTKKINQLTEDDTINPFDNTLVIIDEVHNFISRVINGSTISEKIYELIYEAENCKILCLSGTPLINKPLELAFLVNLIKRSEIEYTLKTNESLDDKKIRKLEDLLDTNKFLDHYTYNALEKKLLIKLVPFSFSRNKDYKLSKDKDSQKDMKILNDLKNELNKNDFKFNIDNKAIQYQSLPTSEKKFNKLFINEDDGKIKNEELLMRRILGSISYFVYTKSELFPEIRTNEVVEVELSNIQMKKYIEVRLDELRKEKRFKKESDANQVYKAFTRMLCNFTFPEEIERPYPSKLKFMLSDMDVVDDYNKKVQDKLIKLEAKEQKEKQKNKSTNPDPSSASSASPASPSKVVPDSTNQVPDLTFTPKNYNEDDYQKKITEILDELYQNKEKYLVEDLKLYSPKFHKILENLGKSKGSALIYSQFRKVEGIGILKMVLQANGYAEFKIKKQKNTYVLDIDKEDYNKPKFAEFTGDKEMTSVLLDIFNNNFENVPKEITKELDKIHSNQEEINNGNLRGSLIKIMMITQSGSEGISLKNVRQVHLLEPYWNMIRMDQVIGRAARTGSHLALPKSERNIDVFKYLCSFSKEDLKLRKIQKMDKGLTTDQVINNIAEKKASVMNRILDLMKSAAVDCHLHKKNHENVECFAYPININDKNLVTKIDIEKEELDYMKKQREEQVKLDLNKIKIRDIEYMILFDNDKRKTGQLFDKDEYDKFKTIKFVGLLLKNDKNEYILRLVKD